MVDPIRSTTMSNSEHPTILVTGATGRVGSELVEQLIGHGARVRIGTRHPATVQARQGVDIEFLDLGDPSTLEPALDGVDAVYLMWPFFQSGEAAHETAGPVAEVLGRGARRVVYLSAQAAVAQPDWFWGVVERAVEATVAEWTVLRPTGFAVNTQLWAEQIRAGDTVRWPFGQAARSLIHERDIAAVAATALLESGHHGQRYVITGPQSITQEQQVHAIGDATGRPLRWMELDRGGAERELGLPREMLDSWESFITHPEPVTDEVQRITGRPARSFAAWARDHVADFSSDPEPSDPNDQSHR